MAVGLTPGVEFPGVLGVPISTEMAVNLFGIGAGVFGGLAGLVAGTRLQGVSGDLQAGQLVIPLAVAGISTVVGALLLPSGD